ncbi:hypothetical protein BAE44_0010645 [Dichanthelium oligosanthes]|uniref:F-box domain-containing protein n=1 Tax=Dichanthelium oligosanthes TaxID=888268 RepID=A0A1E5VT82_9POAL|nr:hypothetical protein BAE44_0010645 [Dichanthelium oligosanthes]
MAAAGPKEEDRLSDLPDGVVGHVLSFLSAQEAARAAVLSRRYRHAFASVHTLSFVQEQGSSSTDANSNDFEYRENFEKDRNEGFVALVDAAISCRRRCAGGGADPGLRAFRVAFDSYHHSLAGDVDRWLSAATSGGDGGAVEEIHVDARRQEQRQCARELTEWYYSKNSYDRMVELKDESDGDDADDFRNPNTRDRAYHVPRWLYSGAAAAASLRKLCLGSCFLDLPAGEAANLHFPSIETLALIWIPDSGRDIQLLICSCPRLVDLTLDSCRRVRAVTVLNTRLRRLVLRCCHGARLTVDASDLRVLVYRGPVPDESVLSFAGSPPAIVSCDIEFCGKMASSEAELVNANQFLARFTDARWLRLGSSCMGSGMEKTNSLGLGLGIRQLELKGALTSSSAISAVTRILEQTPNLEVLTLLILPDVQEFPRYPDAVICDPDVVGLDDVPDDVPPVIPCLRNRVREINVVHYQGRVAQRSLLKLLLLRSGSALEELCVVFPEGKYAVQSMLMGEIESWVMDRPVKVVFA